MKTELRTSDPDGLEVQAMMRGLRPKRDTVVHGVGHGFGYHGRVVVVAVHGVRVDTAARSATSSQELGGFGSVKDGY